MNNKIKKKFIIIGIEIVLALSHIIGIGCHASEKIFIISASYFSDFALPFGFYFLLKLSEEKINFLQKWWVKAGIIFLMAALWEAGHFFGLYVLGRTFDPMDIAVYAAGVIFASFVDWMLSNTFKFWKIDS